MIKKILGKCMKVGKYFVSLNLLLIIIYGIGMLIPYIFSHFIDSITQYKSLNLIKEPMIIITVATLILMVSSYIKDILSELTISKITYEFLNEVDSKLEHIPLTETSKHNPAYLNNRIFSDIYTTVSFVISNLIVSIIMLISTFILLFMIASINMLMFYLVFFAMLINVLSILYLNKLVYKRGYDYRDQNNIYLSVNNDRLASIKETKMHSWYDISGERLDSAFVKLLVKGISLNKVIAILNNIGNLTKNITLVLTILIGGKLLIEQNMTIGQLILITSYTNMCLANSEFFLKLGQGFQHAKICFSRLEEFTTVEDEKNGTMILETINSIEIKNLSFAYPEMPPLYLNLNLNLSKGKVYCLKGKNGEGKSTFVDLLLGLNYAYKGSISYNGVEISDIDMRLLRNNKISVIMQETILQRISVKDNLLRGISKYSPETMANLCNKFNLNKIIESDDAMSLSGGEKQKISIIRGLLKESDVLILDEPISAMDKSGIMMLKKEIDNIKDEKIIIFISHNDELFDIVDEFIELSIIKN